ncbi:hypothetical protein P4S64_13110 [Vibrio sp. M60_M31a]
MMQFTDWDILRNLLLAARWTVLLSIIAFIGGGLVGLGLTLLRSMKNIHLGKGIQLYVELFSGNATSDAALYGVFRFISAGDRG